MNRYFLIPVLSFFGCICIFVIYLQFINEDWKFLVPKKELPTSCNDETDVELITHIEDIIEGRSFNDKDDKLFSEKSWDEKLTTLKFWGSDEEQKPDDEFRYRIRISPMDDVSKVFLDLPNGSLNNSEESRQIIKIIFEQLK